MWIVKLSEKNHFSFIEQLKLSKNISLFDYIDYKVIRTEKYIWPNLIFDINSYEYHTFNDINQKIIEKEIPPFILINCIHSGHWEDLLIKNKYRLILDWTIMYLEVEKIKYSHVTNNFNNEISIKLISEREKKEIDAFTNIVQKNLNNNNPIPDDLFYNLSKSNNFKLLLAYKDNNPCGTLLLYYTDNICGIYMVAVNKEFRKQGIASRLLRKAIELVKETEIKTIILQSTNEGLPLYKKHGFINTQITMKTFWKIGFFSD